MSEEKPTFKITDRRLFNADGTPREGAREQEPPLTVSSESHTAAPTAAGPSFAAEGQRAESASREPAPAPHAAPASEARAAGAEASAPRGGVRDAAGAEASAPDDDPQEFLMVVEFIASFAADALGMVNHPGAGEREVNLPLAKQCIDMLGTLERKTRGNLSAEEQQFFELILSQLRMQYVSLTGAPRAASPGGPRGFSGGDITGGR